jgi:gephyrin
MKPFAGVLTVSDSASRGQSEDHSGPLLAQLVQALWPDRLCVRALVPDDRERIAAQLRTWADAADLALILTTGGTGFAPRDVTPEATRQVIDREAPGIAEAIRAAGLAATPHAMLSRGVAGIRGRTLIVNLSGSPKAVREQFAVIAPVLPHALELLRPDAEGIRHARAGEHRREG